jgi:glycosyltransferase involved in cell wall biosynthesis
MPNSVLESLASGCPVIISEAANAGQIVESNVTGWTVRDNNIKHLASTISKVLTLPDEELMKMRSQCKDRAAVFSMRVMVDAYESLYQRMCRRMNFE